MGVLLEEKPLDLILKEGRGDRSQSVESFSPAIGRPKGRFGRERAKQLYSIGLVAFPVSALLICIKALSNDSSIWPILFSKKACSMGPSRIEIIGFIGSDCSV